MSRLWGVVIPFLFLLGVAVDAARAVEVDPAVLDGCPGYDATSIEVDGPRLSAKLVLAGTPCNVFGNDIKVLDLDVVYETSTSVVHGSTKDVTSDVFSPAHRAETRIHLKITDASNTRYEVPESVLPRPAADPSVLPDAAQIKFTYTSTPFSFNISRSGAGEVLFTTAAYPLIFEPQYLRIKSALPPSPNIYGLGENSEPFRLDATNTTRTLWSRDAYGIPRGTNLYGNHPVYFEHRPYGGTHGVFLLSSSGMDVKIRGDGESATTLEYNLIGGIIDFYFLAGSESDPAEVARQYAQIVGTPAEVPYWSFGLHQCRYGYRGAFFSCLAPVSESSNNRASA